MKLSIKKMTLIAIMASLMTVCSWLTIPAIVPFTMQTFAVFCSLLLLGGKFGLTAIVLYLFMGCIGLPVFAGFRGGIAHIVGLTGGYLIGFIFSAVLYLLLEPLFPKFPKLRLAALLGGLILCYLVGTIWFQVVFSARGDSYSFGAVLSICVFPYVIPDLLKLAVAYHISNRIRKEIRFFDRLNEK